MTQLMQISHPFLFFIPIMALFVGIQFLYESTTQAGIGVFSENDTESEDSHDQSYTAWVDFSDFGIFSSGPESDSFSLLHCSHQILATRTPFGDCRDGLCERNIQTMHTIRSKNVDRSSHRRRHRRDKDCETSIIKLFNDESGNKRILNLDQRRSPGFVLRLSRESLRKTSQERVTGNLLK